MTDGVRRFLSDEENRAGTSGLTDIYFVAFREPDVDVLIQEMKRAFPSKS